LAQAAIRTFHTHGAVTARSFLAGSKVGGWSNHERQSMATNNQRVLDGLDWYIQEDAADGRPMNELDQSVVVNLNGTGVTTRLDVVLDDGADLAARIVFWDGPDFDANLAPTIACVFAHALVGLYPGRDFTTVGIWQARRQYKEEVPHAAALARTTAAHNVLSGM
jgi:hypothetical protein